MTKSVEVTYREFVFFVIFIASELVRCDPKEAELRCERALRVSF